MFGVAWGKNSQLDHILPTCKELGNVWFKTLHKNSRSRYQRSILQMGKLKLSNLSYVGKANIRAPGWLG